MIDFLKLFKAIIITTTFITTCTLIGLFIIYNPGTFLIVIGVIVVCLITAMIYATL